MTTHAMPHLTVRVTREKTTAFASLLQHGVLYAVEQPSILGDFLLDLPGFSREYLETTVQTIFVDGTAADSFAAPLFPGSTLALSAAMPGLAGAIFRRQGLHSSLRSRPVGEKHAKKAESGHIKVKLFNRIAVDRVFDILSRGAFIEGPALHNFATRRADLFQAPALLFLDHGEVSIADVFHICFHHPIVVVQVQEFEQHEE